MKKKEHQRHSWRSQGKETKEEAPEHPSTRALLGTIDDNVINVAGQVYQGEWTLVPSMLSHCQHDECMRELQCELNRWMVRASLQEVQETHGTLSLSRASRSRRCSQGCSASQTWSPSWGTMGKRGHQMAKRRLTPIQCGSWRWHSQIEGQE